MRVKNFGFTMPREMHDTQEWLFAIDAFDYADPEPLAELLEQEGSIPRPYRKAVADIVRGERKPNKRAAAKLKLPARDRLSIGAELSIGMGVIDILKNTVDRIGDRKGIEPIEALRMCEEEAAALFEEYAEMHGVSIETLENVLRDLRKIAENWPNV